MKRLANLEEPKTIDDARARLINTTVEIDRLNDALAARFRYREDDGMPMEPEEYLEWRKKASGAKNWFVREATICQQWIEAYERDVRAEEQAERLEKTLEIQRKNAADKRARAETLRKRDAENNEWRLKMIQEHGSTKLPPDIARAEMLKLEQTRLELKQAELARIGSSAKLREQKARHKEWLRQLEITDPVTQLDPMTLLNYAFRLLTKLKDEGRVDFTDEEWMVFRVISERQLIINNFENDPLLTKAVE